MTNSERRHFLQLGVATGTSFVWSVANVFALQVAKSPPPGPVTKDIIAASKAAKLSMQFHGKTADEFREWRKQFRTKIAKLLGPHEPPKKWKAVEEKKIELADHTRYELLLSAKGVASVPVYLLIPKGASKAKPVPAVLCVHGHGNYGHHPIVGRTDLPGVAKAIERTHYDYGLQFVKRGYAVAAPCMVPFGRRVDRAKYGRTDPCATTFVRMQALGKTTMGQNLRDLSWCLDLLQSRPEVKKEKLGCAGLSYGGRMTMLAAAMDQRIKIAAVSGALNLLQERIFARYSCGSQIIPGLLKYGDYSEIGSLIAPQHAVWEVGSKDRLVVPGWDKKFKDRLKRAYAALGVTGRLKFDHFDGGHRWNGEVAYPLFAKLLK